MTKNIETRASGDLTSVSVRQTRLELKPSVSQDRVHAIDRAHHARRLRDFQIYDPTHPSDLQA